VGQIARIKGARAVGIAGGPEKCAFVQNELGFDAAIDHRAPDFAERLAAACGKGIDVYFENVGGPIWQAVLPLLNLHARVPVCGLIANYNGPAADTAAGAETGMAGELAATLREVLSRRLLVQGFINSDFAAQRPAFLNDVSGWIADGRVRFRQEIVAGLENAPAAFIGMLDGRNFGKLLIDVAWQP
jgi:NADPH-dependent curcumin reductase CurA